MRSESGGSVVISEVREPLQPPVGVLLVLDCLAAGGAQTFALDLATEIDAARFKITVCALRTKDPGVAAAYRDAGVDLVELRLAKGSPLAMPRIYKLIKERGIGIVHTMLFASDTYGRLAAIFARVDGVVVHKLANDGMWKSWYHVAVDRLLTRKTDLVMANAEAVRRYYVEREKTPMSKTVIVHHPVNLSRIKDSHPADLRGELGLSRGRPLVGVAGRLVEQKDLETFLKAAARLAARGSDAAFIIVGEGPLLSSIRAGAERLGIADKAHFLGRRSDPLSVIGALDVFVNCSKYEGLPVTILESMALGVPVVASAVDGNVEVAKHEETALVFEPGDDEALAAHIERYLADPDLARRLSARAAAFAAANYSMPETVLQLERIYANLAGRR